MSRAHHISRRTVLLLGALLVLALLAALGEGTRGSAEAALGDPLEPPPPNIVLIMTDDQPAATVTPATMPKLFERMVAPGTSFSDYIVTTPLCCPSRATTLTGQYGHNNGVLRNDYAGLIGKPNVLPVWLQKSGYSTAHVGKYLNGFGAFEGDQKAVAPGWERWFTLFEKKRYYNWRASKNGGFVKFGEKDSDHLTEVTNRIASRWAAKLAKRPDPFYLQVDHFAPHGAAGRGGECRLAPVPAPRDEGRFSNASGPSSPNYNEEDVSDKPGFIRGRPPIDAATDERIRDRWRCTLAAVRSVDRGIGRIFRKIERQGELERTVFIFTSDNGYYFGEHRISRGKVEPYEENLRMPLTILVPDEYRDGRAPGTVDSPTANLDLAPTILELAGAQPCKAEGRCRVMDGRSLLPLLDGSGDWPADRSLMIELESCQYRGVRSQGEIYFEYSAEADAGDCEPTDIERYDLEADPFQLENLYPSPEGSAGAEIESDLGAKLRKLSDCAGIRGRDRPPASGSYCE